MRLEGCENRFIIYLDGIPFTVLRTMEQKRIGNFYHFFL